MVSFYVYFKSPRMIEIGCSHICLMCQVFLWYVSKVKCKSELVYFTRSFQIFDKWDEPKSSTEDERYADRIHADIDCNAVD